MSRKPSRRLKAVFAEMDAEDRAVRYLATLPPDVAVIASLKAALELSTLWEMERRQMIRRDDPRPVYLIGERPELYSVAATFCQNNLWQRHSDEHLHELFARLPPDAAALVAYQVARWVCHRVARQDDGCSVLSILNPTGTKLPERLFGWVQ
jgi:hypothetical protein